MFIRLLYFYSGFRKIIASFSTFIATSAKLLQPSPLLLQRSQNYCGLPTFIAASAKLLRAFLFYSDVRKIIAVFSTFIAASAKLLRPSPFLLRRSQNYCDLLHFYSSVCYFIVVFAKIEQPVILFKQ